MTDLDKYHAFGDAIRAGDRAAFDRILDSSPELINDPDDPMPFLIKAAQNGRADFVVQLIRAGADLEATCEFGAKTTALIPAVRSGSAETVKVLLDHGAKMTATDHGNDVMFCAIMNGHAEIARLLLDHGYDSNIEHGTPREEGSDEPPWNALTFAVARGQVEIAEAIITRSQYPIDGAADIIEQTSKKFFPVNEAEALNSKVGAHKVGIQSMALFDALYAKYPLLEVRSSEREEGLPALLSIKRITGPRECLIEPADETEALLSDVYSERWPHTHALEKRAVEEALRMLVEAGYGFVQNAVDAYPEEEMLTACRMLSENYASRPKLR